MDQGAKWNDIVDGTVPRMPMVQWIPTHQVFIITYSATDTAGNSRTGRSYHPGGRSGCTGDHFTRDANITHEAGPEYVDAGHGGMIPWMAMVRPMPMAR